MAGLLGEAKSPDSWFRDPATTLRQIRDEAEQITGSASGVAPGIPVRQKLANFRRASIGHFTAWNAVEFR
jgi:hypothetical protein